MKKGTSAVGGEADSVEGEGEGGVSAEDAANGDLAAVLLLMWSNAATVLGSIRECEAGFD